MSFLIAGAATASLIGGFIGSGAAKKRRRAAERAARAKQRELNKLEASRQAVINPYADVKSLADMAKDLSGELSNPFANLGVATKAAEIQIEQSDIALANTLDTLRATGASAGGATALAQAALKSKSSGSNLRFSAFSARNWDFEFKIGISCIISTISFIIPLQCNTTSHPAFNEANALLDKDPLNACIEISSVINNPSKPIFSLIILFIIGDIVAHKFGSRVE